MCDAIASPSFASLFSWISPFFSVLFCSVSSVAVLKGAPLQMVVLFCLFSSIFLVSFLGLFCLFH